MSPDEISTVLEKLADEIEYTASSATEEIEWFKKDLVAALRKIANQVATA